jgi:hypothetical protein
MLVIAVGMDIPWNESHKRTIWRGPFEYVCSGCGAIEYRLVDLDSNEIIATVTHETLGTDAPWRVWKHNASYGEFQSQQAAQEKAEKITGSKPLKK